MRPSRPRSRNPPVPGGLRPRECPRSTSACPFESTRSSCLPSYQVLSHVYRRYLSSRFLGGPPPLHTTGNAVKHDRQDHDADTTDKGSPDVELAESHNDRLPKSPGSSQGGDDHHREREHDDLVDPGHDRP